MFIKYFEEPPRFETLNDLTTEAIENITITIYFKTIHEIEAESLSSNDSFILQII